MPEIKERPILFSAPMVRAILEGRKTVTRRKVKKRAALDCLAAGLEPAFLILPGNADLCPYGAPGDRLWVRETWYCDHFEVQKGPYLQPADMHDLDQSREDGELVYAADGLTPHEQEQPTWKPSIHMPRWACRILLEITDVRVERLQEISEEQAVAEGLIWQGQENGKAFYSHAERKYPPGAHQQFGISGVDAISAFRNLWNSVGGDWDANPWVWCVSFRRVEQ